MFRANYMAIGLQARTCGRMRLMRIPEILLAHQCPRGHLDVMYASKLVPLIYGNEG